MKVAIVGPGRVGTLLALALPRAGHRLEAVVGGSTGSQQALRGRVAGARITTLAEAAERAELVIIATGDHAIAGVAEELAREDLLGERHRVIHLAGSLGLKPLRAAHLAGAGVAAIHPAQTIPANADPESLVGAAWAVTAAGPDRVWARALVTDLGGDPHDVADADRVLYHAALVLGSNAVAAAMSAARQLLMAAGVEDPSGFLGPLGTASLQNVLVNGAAAITGPAVRGDVDTIRGHLDQLEADLPHLAAAYRHLQRAVVGQVAPGLDAAVVAELTRALADPT